MARFVQLGGSVIPAGLLVVLLLCLGVASVAPISAEPAASTATAGGESGNPPEATLQDAPDLLIFHTGEVKGTLIPGG